MPFMIPIVVAWGTGAIAAVAAGAATLGTTLSVIGAALTAVGGLTKNEDLLKLGGVMGLAGGVTNLASGAASGAESVASADAASDIGFDPSMGGGNTAISASTGNTALATNAATTGGQELGSGLNTSNVSDSAREAIAAPSTTDAAQASARYGGTAMPGAAGTTDAALGFGADKLGQPAGMLPEAEGWLNKLGSVVRNNKELFQIGGKMLEGMYGPDAEALDMQKQIYERRRRNLNSPVRLGMLGTMGQLGKGGG